MNTDFKIAEAKKAWPSLIELSESMHQLFGHSYEVIKLFAPMIFILYLISWLRRMICVALRSNLRRIRLTIICVLASFYIPIQESANKIYKQDREHRTRKDTPLHCLKDMLVHARVSPIYWFVQWTVFTWETLHPIRSQFDLD